VEQKQAIHGNWTAAQPALQRTALRAAAETARSFADCTLTDTHDTVIDANKWANAALTRFGGGERERVGVVVMLARRMVHAVLAAHPRPPFEVL